MRIVGNNVSVKQAQQVEKIVRRCVKQLKKKKYNLNLPVDAEKTAVDVLIIKNRPGTPSKAGANRIQINLGYWQNDNPIHREYKSFSKDYHIGDRSVSDNFDHLMITIAHEVSHFIQMRYCHKHPVFKHTWRKPHGDCFRTIYKYLRRDLINPSIKERIARNGTMKVSPEKMEKLNKPTPVFKVGQIVSFKTRKETRVGEVMKVNRKNLKVVEKMSADVQNVWNVPKLIAEIKPEG